MNATSRILVTGASGFVGRAVCAEAIIRGLNVRAATRVRRGFPSYAEDIVVGDISSNTDWGDALKDCHVVVHLAARVHVIVMCFHTMLSLSMYPTTDPFSIK